MPQLSQVHVGCGFHPLHNNVDIHTLLDMSTAAGIVNQVFRQHKAMVDPIEMSSNPLDQLEGEPDLAVVGARAGKMNNGSCRSTSRSSQLTAPS